MGMGQEVASIEKLENGYEVEICDPEIMASNAKPKSTYKNPRKGYAFTTDKEVIAFLTEHLSSLKPPPDADMEYEQSFKAATAESE